MATRKAITLVSGLFQEVNTPTDKLDFAGNTTADLTENTNLYYTDTRSRAAISVTDSGGDGSLAYNNSTGVVTYTGPSSAEARAHFSVASGSGLTYNSGTGEFGTSAIPNSQLANDDITIGSTAIALGATGTTIAGLTSLASTTLIAGTEDGGSSIEIGAGSIAFEGTTADANEIRLTAPDATGGDKVIQLPNESGTILTTASSIANSNLANSTITFGSASVALGSTVTGISLTNIQAITKLQVGEEGGAGNIVLHASNSGGFSQGITFEGSSGGADANETLLAVTDPTADRTITLPDATGTVALLSTLSIASGSGLTYNSSTGEFSTNAIPNSQLANSSVTVGSTGIALGGSATTITGLSSLTSSAIVTDDNGFRVRDNSDNTKQLAFECSGISTSTTRTLTVPDANGTIATQAYVQAQITAEDLDVQTDSGNFDVDLDSEPLILTGGTGIDTSGSGTTATFAIDATVATLAGSQTLTNKSVNLANNTLTGTLAQFNTAVSDATLVSTTGSETLTNKTLTSAVLNGTISGTSIKDEDNMASDSASHLATQQSIKAYVDTQLTAEDLDVQTDSGNFDVDLDSEALIIAGGTGIDTSGTGTTATVAIDSTVTTLTGLSSVTSTAVVTDDSGFRIRDNSDNTKQLAFECSGISGSTTRTLTAPDANGTIATQAYVQAQITAEDLDITTDDGNSIAIDLDSETLTLAGGTGIASTSTGNTATFAIDSTVTTLTGTQTLTNKSLTAPVLTGSSSSAGSIVFKEDTDNGTNSATLKGPAATADVTLTLPATDGTVSTESFATAIAVALG